MLPYDSHLTSLRPDAVARKVLLVSAAVTLALYVIPFGRILARPLLLLSTLAHEIGHRLTALLLGGSFDASRYGPTEPGSPISTSPASAGSAESDPGRGLIGPSVAAALCFAVRKPARGPVGV